MNKLRNCIANQVTMHKDSMNAILSVFKPMELAKGEHFLQSGKKCRDMVFIDTGYMRMYDLVDGKEITFWIGYDGKFMTSLSSFIFETSLNG